MNAETTPPALTPDERRQRVFEWLDAHSIRYTWYEHPEAPTIEIARQYWRNDGSKHCKNLFFRNHKGNRHYLVSFDAEQSLAIHDLEHRLHQGKLSFANDNRATVVIPREEFLRYLTEVGNSYEFLELY